MKIKQKVRQTESALDIVLSYHEQTKHRLNAYAKGPETIDWSDQPEAFRHYSGASFIDLPFSLESLTTRYDDLFQDNSDMSTVKLSSLSGLLELSFGLSAWKQYGVDRWALRCNPSSGNLHPTEAYLLLLNINGIDDGIYHYCPDQHQLEKRSEVVVNTASKVEPVILICLSSIHWREAWKYGERAFRYSQLDVGHAMAGLRFAAGVYGWQVRTRMDVANTTLDRLFGFDRLDEYQENETESSELLLELQISKQCTHINIEDILTTYWFGKANLLSTKHFYDWPAIEQVHAATQNPGESQKSSTPDNLPRPLLSSTELATTIIKQRRSAQIFDGQTMMPEPVFWRCLDKTLARSNFAPFDLLAWQARIHLVIFVHRVENLKQGLYLLTRREDALSLCKSEFRSEFSYERIDSQYTHLSIYKLVEANSQNAAKSLFCHQDIASNSAFSIGMLAELHTSLIDSPWHYRQLFWEAGMIGQALYLEAEANGFRATGVGCFFDDSFHKVLGLKTNRLQSVYHFTVGTPIIDQRITSLSGYYHISR